MNYVVGYARVSTDEQRDKNTVATQLDEMQRWAQAYGEGLQEVYVDESVSGTTPLPERPSGARLMLDARANRFDTLVVFKFDRIARSARDLLNLMNEFDELGIKVVSLKEALPTEGPMRGLTLGLLAILAEFEKGIIEERTKAGKQRRARAGKWPGQSPYGFDVDAHGYLVERKDEADIVREIFRLTADEKLSITEIAWLLNHRRIPNYYASRQYTNRAHGEWSRGQVSKILADRLYKGEATIGKRSSKYGVYHHHVEPLVDERTWQRAREAVEQRTDSGRAPKREYLLTGLVRCGACGGAYVASTCITRYKGEPKEYPYYRCSRSIKQVKVEGHDRCRNYQMRADKLDTEVWSKVRQFICDPGKALELLAGQEAADTNRLESLDKEIASLDQAVAAEQVERARVISAYRKGILTEDDVQFQLRELENDLVKVRRARVALATEREQVVRNASELEAVFGMLADLREGVEDLSFAERKDVVRLLVRGVRVDTVDVDGKRKAQAEVTYVFSTASNAPFEKRTSR